MDCFKAICAMGDRFQIDSGEKAYVSCEYASVVQPLHFLLILSCNQAKMAPHMQEMQWLSRLEKVVANICFLA
jgi:hypothetical protein